MKDSITNFKKDEYYITYTRDGIFKYTGRELRVQGDPYKIYDVYRTKDMILSLLNDIKDRKILFIYGHRNYKSDDTIEEELRDYIIGYIDRHTAIEHNGITYLGGILTITNPDLFEYACEKIGHTEVSSQFKDYNYIEDGKIHQKITKLQLISLVKKGRAQTNTIFDSEHSLREVINNNLIKETRDNRFPTREETMEVENKLKDKFKEEEQMFKKREREEEKEDEYEKGYLHGCKDSYEKMLLGNENKTPKDTSMKSSKPATYDELKARMDNIERRLEKKDEEERKREREDRDERDRDREYRDERDKEREDRTREREDRDERDRDREYRTREREDRDERDRGRECRDRDEEERKREKEDRDKRDRGREYRDREYRDERDKERRDTKDSAAIIAKANEYFTPEQLRGFKSLHGIKSAVVKKVFNKIVKDEDVDVLFNNLDGLKKPDINSMIDKATNLNYGNTSPTKFNLRKKRII